MHFLKWLNCRSIFNNETPRHSRFFHLNQRITKILFPVEFWRIKPMMSVSLYQLCVLIIFSPKISIKNQQSFKNESIWFLEMNNLNVWFAHVPENMSTNFDLVNLSWSMILWSINKIWRLRSYDKVSISILKAAEQYLA